MKPVTVFVASLILAGNLCAQSDAGVAARADALELAGAFSNDGFKLRDGHLVATLDQDSPALVSVNLFSGNAYWFVASTGGGERRITVEVFDAAGNPLEADTHESPGRAAAGVAPALSGEFLVRVRLIEGDPGDVCLLYSYR